MTSIIATVDSLRANGKLTLVYLFLTIQFADIITTAIGLRRGAREANLLPSWILLNYGELGMYAFKVLMAAVVLYAVLRFSERYRRVWLALRIVNFVMIPILVVNLLSIFL